MGKAFGNDSKMSVIGQGSTFMGECKIDGNVRIDGNFNGSLNSANTVVISKTGNVNGDIVAQEAVIGGKVLGNIVAKSKLELKSSAHVEADLETRKLIVEEGVFFQGSCKMSDEKKIEKNRKEESKIQQLKVSAGPEVATT